MNQVKNAERKRLIFFVGMLILGAICILGYLAFTGNTNQTFTDVVIEHTAGDGSNKSAEKNLFYLFSIIGAVVYGIYFTVRKLGQSIDSLKQFKGRSFVLIALLVSLCTNLILYKKLSVIVLAALILVAFLSVINEANTVHGISFMFLSIYGICGLYRLAVFFGVNRAISINVIAVVALIISLAIGVINKDSKIYLRGMLVSQLLIPFALLVFIASKYTYNGEIVSIHMPKRILVLVVAIIAGFVAEAIYKIKNNWAEPKSLQNILSFGACVSIMSFNRFSGSGSIMPTDLHHYYENVIGYSQIFELGQKPFSEYIPVSGMYSVLHGAFFAFFGHGLATFYFVSANMFYLAVIFVIVFLLRKQLSAEWVLLISVLFLVTDYNRITLIVPVILLLTWPKTIENRNLWLKAWFLTSFIHGLYYPVFGAAVCMGFLPMGIWQIYRYAKNGELANDIKKPGFWGWWIVCFIPVLAGIPLLLGTLKHMLAMGSQTIYADGINRFGQIIPDGFMSYISNLPFKLAVYYILTYTVLISIVWLSVALFLYNGKVNKSMETALISLSVGLMFLVAFSYTVVRFDYYDIYSRSDGIVKAAFVVLIVLVSKMVKEHRGNAHWIFAFAIIILSVVSAEGFLQIDSNEKLQSSYAVPESCVYVADYKPRLGEGFIEADTYDYVMRTSDYMDTLDKNQSYMGIVDSFGLFYLCDMKGDSVMEVLNTIKGYGAVEETVDYLRRNDTIVGLNVSPFYNYYFYHWLLTSGDYIFDNNARLFIPNAGQLSQEEVLANNKNISLPLDYQGENIGKESGSFGKSIETLSKIFTENQTGYEMSDEGNSVSIQFAEPINGNDADFAYIEFESLPNDVQYILYDFHNPLVQDAESFGPLKGLLKRQYNSGMKVVVSWINDNGEECSQSCEMDEGKLLLPLGSRRGWLLNTISDITIKVMQDDKEIEVPEIKEIKFLKLREVE
ncbi:hypothetical protein [Pseudobutyrivibrio xylanivorans]|uniref:Uncharacterized protein n=1 Tax=Pseudobutyrivibrio xylanivorans DSM 14809 TaxID=1123012 RepID=A0A1M6JR26_PSEXY|nr:hypothetical protein [Pseudobutyrivibrio xylanivorans]SHJ49139.1 hypothetical protein SAMN02745725_02670 [Pseudobutyrivibrio xylanivorans DSM 14809]